MYLGNLESKIAQIVLSGMVVLGIGAFSSDVSADMRSSLRQALQKSSNTISINGHAGQLQALRSFYAGRGYVPVWSTDRGLGKRGRAVETLLSEVGTEGLHAPDYAPKRDVRSRRGTWPELEIEISARLLRYAADVGGGRISVKKIDRELFAFDREIDWVEILQNAAAAPDIEVFFDTLPPSTADYRALRTALSAYRGIAAAGGWHSLAGVRTLKPGDASPDLARLWERLRITGDVRADVLSPQVLEGRLLDGLIGFQKRHGLVADGIIGLKTWNALNVPVESRIRQILMNMERWRWLPHDLGDPHVFVNLAGFELQAVRGGDVSLRMKVVIGKTYRRTPVFSDRIKYLELNPAWTVPHSIATLDILPKLQKNASFLPKNGFQLLPPAGGQSGVILDSENVQWDRYRSDYFPFRLRQRPGPLNSLGSVKFMFPNRFAVYLHDTPSREQFSRKVRTFSSGCIRVAQPVELAAFLLNSGEWNADHIRTGIKTGKTRVLRLAAPVPVHIAYLTAWVEANGTVNFRDDVYKRDERLAVALFSGK